VIEIFYEGFYLMYLTANHHYILAEMEFQKIPYLSLNSVQNCEFTPMCWTRT